jgi:nucleotide-binding universal stress UspA family protein
VNPRDDVVVGFDGSHHSVAALDWAASEAVRRGARLRVIVAAHYPGMPYPVGLAAPTVPRSLEVLSDELVKRGLQRAAKQLPEGRIDAHVVVAGPAAALVDASADAGLLVVGHRGHGALCYVSLKTQRATYDCLLFYFAASSTLSAL